MKRIILLILSVMVLAGILNAQPLKIKIDQDSCAICKADVSFCNGLIVNVLKKQVGHRTIYLCDSCAQFWDEASADIDKALDLWIARHQRQNPRVVNTNRLERRNAELLEIREKIKGLTDRERELLGVKPKHWWKDAGGKLHTEDGKRP